MLRRISDRMIAFLDSLLHLFHTPFKVEAFGDSHSKVYGLQHRLLYQCLAQLPGVVLPRTPRHFWSGSGVYAEFVLGGHVFQIEGDVWDDGLWVCAKDEQVHAEEMRVIREHLERGVK